MGLSSLPPGSWSSPGCSCWSRGAAPGSPHAPALPTDRTLGSARGNPGVIGRPAAAPASATAPGLKFPGVASTAALPWAFSSPPRSGASWQEVHLPPDQGQGNRLDQGPQVCIVPVKRKKQGFWWQRSQPHALPWCSWGAWTTGSIRVSIRAQGGIRPLKHILNPPNSPLTRRSYLCGSRMCSHQTEAEISRKKCK